MVWCLVKNRENLTVLTVIVSRNISVGIALGYRLDDRWFES
jgi:hypothetical protein